jgi:hypothetical protein
MFIESGLTDKIRATSAIFDSNEGFLEGFEAETEPEAIFKACQRILDNKGSLFTKDGYEN